MTPDAPHRALPAASPQPSLARAVAAGWRCVGRRRTLAAAVVAGVLALTAAALAVAPRRWVSETRLVARQGDLATTLGNPRRPVPPEADAPTRAVADEVLAHDGLVRLVRETDLVRTWEATRPPLRRLRDAVLSATGGSLSDEDRLDALVHLLEERLYVAPEAEAIRIGAVWSDGPTAQRLADAAVRTFLARRRAVEIAPVEDSIAVLEQHVAGAEGGVRAAVDALARIPRPARRSLRIAVAPRADPAAAGLEQALADRLYALEAAGAARRQAVEDEEAKVAALRAIYSDGHPDVESARERAAALGRERSDLGALRREVAELARARAASAERARLAERERAARDAAAARPRPSDPAARYARDALIVAVARYTKLLDRLDDARIERDTAVAAFGRRYEIVRPADPPAAPASPRVVVVLLSALACAILLAVAAAIAVDRAAGPHGVPRVGRVAAAVAAVAVPSIAALVATSSPAAAFALPAVVGLAWLSWTAPVRHGAGALLFLMLAAPTPLEGSGRFRPAWAKLGYLLNSNLNTTLPIGALGFSGMDVIALYLCAIVAWRRATRSRIDGDPAGPLPLPLVAALLASAATLAGEIAYGVVRGGNVNQMLWQCHAFGYLAIVVFVLGAAARDTGDVARLGKIVVAAALVKALLAIWVRHVVAPGLGVDIGTATTHADSMLFVVALCIVGAAAMEHRARGARKAALWIAPVILAGMQANQRRLAWVELAGVGLLVLALSPRTRLKRAMAHAGLVLVPVCALYVAAGWSSSSRVFGPVAKIRSIVDSKSDRSSEERDVENYNLVRNVLERPFVGAGFGHEYVQYVKPDDLSAIFPQWRYIPHNSVLGLLAFCGIVGVTGLWMVLAITVFLAARSRRLLDAPRDRAAAVAAIGAVLVYLFQCYGDMGFQEWHGVLLVALACVSAGRLAETCGAWPRRAPARAAPVHLPEGAAATVAPR